MIQMRYEDFWFIFAFLLIAGAYALHGTYLGGLYSELYKLKKRDFNMDQLCQICRQPQGSNFNTLAISSWSLLFVCLAFLFFLTPDIYGYGLLKIPTTAAGELSFGFFALLVMGISLPFYGSIPKIYSYYEVPVILKKSIFYCVPVLLFSSLLISTYLGTIYPARNDAFWNLSYLLMILGESALLLPIYVGAGGRLR